MTKDCTKTFCDICHDEITTYKGSIKIEFPKRILGFLFVPHIVCNYEDVCRDCARELELAVIKLQKKGQNND